MRISISKVKLFKACRRAYQLHYIEGLEPVEKSDAIQTGSNYHALLEGLYKTGSLPTAEGDWSKELAMAKAYEKYIYPEFKVAAAEKWIEGHLGEHELVGIADGIAEDGSIVEHKTTGTDLDEYEYSLAWDEQMLVYMWLTGTRNIYYTICRKPTIRQKKNESDEEFYRRMAEWYDEDTDSKIRLLRLSRTDEEVEAFIAELNTTVAQMVEAEENSWAGNPFYKNTCYCNHWGRRCEYASVCLHYDPEQEYVEFIKRQ